MATDARGHTVPAASDVPSRNTILNALLSVKDLTPVTNTTTRGSTATAVSPSITNPLMVVRADARPDSRIEYTEDGSTYRSVPLSSGATTYTPALTSSGSPPTLGTGGTATGTYITLGQWVNGYGDIRYGSSGVGAGTGTYEISLPVAAPAGSVSAGVIVGTGTYIDVSAGSVLTFELRLQSTTTARMLYTGTASGIGAAAPVVPAVTDAYDFTFSYLGA